MLNSLLRLLQGKRAERIVWTADITYWITGQKQAGTADPTWDTEEGYLQLHRELGIMPYYDYGHFWTYEAQYSGGVEFAHKTDGNQNSDRFRTPVGDLVEISTYLPQSCSTGCVKHYVESEQDLDILLYVLEHRQLKPANLDDYPELMGRWQRFDGLPAIGLPRSPLASMVYELAGIQNSAYLFFDCKQKMTEALRLMEEQEDPIIDAVCALAPPLVHFPDNLSSDNLTGYYDAYMAPGHLRRLNRLHAAGVKCAVHLDGTVTGLLPKLVAAGFDAIESITPAPAGDLDFEQIEETAGNDDVILWGGVPGVMFAPPYTWAEMKAHIHRLLDCWQGRPFIVGVADQVPPNGDITFCRRIAELLEQA